MAKASEWKSKILKLSREHTAWVYDIVMDYTLQLQAAGKYYENEKTSLEGLLKSAENKESADGVVKALEALNKDKIYVDIAKQRHAELKQLIEWFLEIESVIDATPIEGTPVEWVNLPTEEQVHTTDEEAPAVQDSEETVTA